MKLNNKVQVSVSGNSMFPSLKDGDVVIVNPIEAYELLSTGNIVVFFTNNHLVIHRIIDVVHTQNYVMVKTKGDNNLYDDGYLPASSILGVVYEDGESKNSSHCTPESHFF